MASGTRGIFVAHSHDLSNKYLSRLLFVMDLNKKVGMTVCLVHLIPYSQCRRSLIDTDKHLHQ